MKSLRLILILYCILMSFPLLAEEPIQQQTQGEVSFVTGGVGFYERAELNPMRTNYNLSLLFYLRDTGEYLSAVKVHITDLTGNTFLDTVSEGPELFAKLPFGRYIITVEFNGKTYHKTVSVRGNKNISLSFTWPKALDS